MPNYQAIYHEVNTTQDDSPELTSALKNAFDAKNQHYGYFTTEAEQTSGRDEFIRYFKLLNRVKDDEDKDVSLEELYSRAYHATVLFGGGAAHNACVTLDRLIKELPQATKPVHDVFATVQLPIKASNLNLSLWREWINGPQTKKALKLFASASDIANKFGPLQRGWTLTLTKTFPNSKNTHPGKLYLHKHKDETKLGYAFLDEAGTFCSGTINKADLEAERLQTLLSNWADSNWKSGERSADLMKPSEQAAIFSVVSLAAKQTLSQTLTLSDIEILEGKLTYERFNEAPELAQLCRLYKKPESIFNQCLELLSQQKTSDTLPDVPINGGDVGHPGYHLLKLPVNDPRALLLGDITNCCQSIGSNSQQCVIDGWMATRRPWFLRSRQRKESVLKSFDCRLTFPSIHRHYWARLCLA